MTEYGYLSSVNNYYLDLLFSIKPIRIEALERYTDFMRGQQGVEHYNWEYITRAVPVAVPTNP